MVNKTHRQFIGEPWRVALAFFAGACLIGVIALGGVYFHYSAYVKMPVLREGESRTLVIPSNTSWPQVVDILEEAQLVKRGKYFDYWGKKRGLPQAVRAGTFQLSGPMQLEDLEVVLRRGGMAEEILLSVPEGFTIFHIADRVEQLGLASREDFLRAARDQALLSAAEINADSFEGYLFPDSYRFRQGTSARAIVERMHAQWVAVWADIKSRHADNLEALAQGFGFSEHEVIILASLVERETSVNDERSLVSRVFLNRLTKKMRLQTDPTCVYGEETYREIPHPRYCRDALNRYSTYVIAGLPPGPIANPGRASLEAALAPSNAPEALEYLFFVARRDGTARHHFTRTFGEHNKAVNRYLKGGK